MADGRAAVYFRRKSVGRMRRKDLDITLPVLLIHHSVVPLPRWGRLLGRALSQRLPCVKGGAEERGGGIVKFSLRYEQPLSRFATAPLTQGSLWLVCVTIPR